MQALTTAVLSALMAVSVSAAETGVTDAEVSIGVCTALDGFNKQVSQEQTDGAKAYIEYVNKELKGVAGRTIKLVFNNDGFNPEKAIDCFNANMAAGVFAQAFVNGAPTAAKYVAMAESNKVPLVGVNSGAPFLFHPFRKYTFPSRSPFMAEADLLAARLAKDLDPKRVAMIYQSDAFGANYFQAVAAALAKVNIELVSTGAFDRGSTEVAGVVQSAKAGNPDVVFMAGSAISEAAVLKAAKDLGWNPVFVILIGRDNLVELAGPAAEGIVLSWPFPMPTDTKYPAVALYGKVLAKYVPEAKKTLTSLDGFVQAMILVEGLKRTGKDLTRDNFIAAMETLKDWDPGLNGTYKVNYSTDRHEVVNAYTTVQAKDGKLVPIDGFVTLKK